MRRRQARLPDADVDQLERQPAVGRLQLEQGGQVVTLAVDEQVVPDVATVAVGLRRPACHFLPRRRPVVWGDAVERHPLAVPLDGLPCLGRRPPRPCRVVRHGEVPS